MAGVRGGEKGSDRLTDHVGIGVLTRTVPRYIVDEVLAETGRTEKRTRLLPAHVVVYFVMALSLFRDGYEEVIRHLVHGLRFARTWSTRWQVPTVSALCQARVRLGEEPVRDLFARLATPVAGPGTPGAWLGSWRLMAIDGLMLDVPDTEANIAAYPKAVGGTRRPFPQVKIVGLGECGSHALLAAGIGSIKDGERALAAPLTSSITPGMLVLADRGFFSFDLWATYLATGADLVWRVARTVKLPVLALLPDGSYRSEIKRASVGKLRIPLAAVDDPRHATHLPVRVIEYDITTGDATTHPEVFRLITTILNPDQADAHTLAMAYAQRWELESSFREIECQLLQSGSTLRSKTPEMVRQEIWGLFLTHYAIRSFMAEAADTTEIDPDRISTIRAINIVRRSVTDPAVFSPQHEKTPPRPRDR